MKISITLPQFLKGAAVFIVVGGALAGIFFALGSTDLLSWLISGYAGLFAVYILARNGVFALSVRFLPYGETQPQRAKFRKVPSRGAARGTPDPVFLNRQEIEKNRLSPNIRVIGLHVGENSIAFPLPAMAVSEAVALPSSAGRSTSASWWPVTFSARVFEQNITSEPYVVHNSVVITDEEGVKRLQFDGQDITAEKDRAAIALPPLRQLPTALTTWQAWQEAYPETKLFSPEGVPEQDIFERYYISHRAGIYPERAKDTRLAGKEVVIGIETQNESMAWAYSALRSEGVRNELIDRVSVLVAFDEVSATACVFDRRISGRTLTFEVENPVTEVQLPKDDVPETDVASDADTEKDEESEDSVEGTFHYVSDGDNEGEFPSEDAPDYEPMTLIDKETKSRWHFMTGECLEGEMKGETLRRLNGMTGFWFAWLKFHPHTKLYAIENDTGSAQTSKSATSRYLQPGG